MEDPAIENYLDETIRLARVLGIRGTPAFVIGDTLVPGVVGGARLKELIAKARSGQLRPRSAVKLAQPERTAPRSAPACSCRIFHPVCLRTGTDSPSGARGTPPSARVEPDLEFQLLVSVVTVIDGAADRVI